MSDRSAWGNDMLEAAPQARRRRHTLAKSLIKGGITCRRGLLPRFLVNVAADGTERGRRASQPQQRHRAYSSSPRRTMIRACIVA